MDIVAVLEEDPDLAKGVSGPRLAPARKELRAEAMTIPTGPWDAGRMRREVDGGFGLLVLDGVLARRVGRGGRYGAELLGRGDLIRPDEDEGDSLTAPLEMAWRVIQPTRVALLDHRFLQRCTPYPEIGVCLVNRASSRARRILVHMAIAHHARVDKRLELLLWHLADRWGRVTPHGVAMPVRLTHELLADLVAAQRPSVTLSLQQLERAGRLTRRDSIIYLLGEPPDEDADDLDDVQRTAA